MYQGGQNINRCDETPKHVFLRNPYPYFIGDFQRKQAGLLGDCSLPTFQHIFIVAGRTNFPRVASISFNFPLR